MQGYNLKNIAYKGKFSFNNESKINSIFKTNKKHLILSILLLFCNIKEVKADTINKTIIWQYDHEVLPLKGQLNDINMANSNSPEIIKTEGILLSTFPPEGKSYPEAHLDYTLKGDFDIFTHHIATGRDGDYTDVYQGILLYNPNLKPVILTVKTSASYITSQAPFKVVDNYLENQQAQIYAGPGDRVSQDILRNRNYLYDKTIKIPSKGYYLLLNESIPISENGKSNARTCLFKLHSEEGLYLADLALFKEGDNKPKLEDWLYLLKKGSLSEKRDYVPTPIDRPFKDKFYYGRVAGIAKGSEWSAKIINSDNLFKIPLESGSISYGLNTLYNNTLSTHQIQTAKIERRYADTAYQAHGNYGVTYQVEIPLYNPRNEAVSLSISFDSPIRIKENENNPKVEYFDKPPEKINFRGEFKIEYESFSGTKIERFIHVVQRFGEQGLPIASLHLSPKEQRNLKITFIYPADCTPPHVFTLSY